MAVMEEEKENPENDLLDCRARLLKFANKEKKWQEYMTSTENNEKKWKEIHDEIERKLEGREKEIEERMGTHVAQTSEKP